MVELRSPVFWRRLAKDVAEYVALCPICSLTKHSQSQENPTFSMSDKCPPPFHTIHMDVAGPLPWSGRKEYIWVLV
ncbi:MAG: hypothetical protein GY774_25620, partial [Planctomycetes bacterium]|nr:hypothetical protein [Planctomycetota bacterium]